MLVLVHIGASEGDLEVDDGGNVKEQRGGGVGVEEGEWEGGGQSAAAALLM